MKGVLYRWQSTHLAWALWKHFQGQQAFEQGDSGEPLLIVPVLALPAFRIPDHSLTLSASAYDAALRAMSAPALRAFYAYIFKSRSSQLYGLKTRTKPSGPYVSLEAHSGISPALRWAGYTLLRHAERPSPDVLEQIWLEYEAAAELWAA